MRACSSRPFVLSLILALIFLLPAATSAEDLDVEGAVERLFAEHSEESFVAVVLDDAAQGRYLAFYISAYLDLRELRAYVIPYASADRAVVDPALADGDQATAFTSLLSTMRLTLGAQYVSDVNLDGVRDEEVQLGEGTIRDGFHHEIFADHGEADRAYRGWLTRALELRES